MNAGPSAPDRRRGEADTNTFSVMMVATVTIALAALLLAELFSVDLAASIHLTFSAVAAGVVATIPLLFVLVWFANTKNPHLTEFRTRQIELFADIGFAFTRPRIIAISIAAGVCEELFFRGFLQTWLVGVAGVIVAIIVSNLIFGALHMRTVLYAVLAALIGAYLGVLCVITDSLAAPIVTHALYDLAALEYMRRAINARRQTRPDSSSGSSVTG
jgi:membrane protease YdiL (CAAX protease family)